MKSIVGFLTLVLVGIIAMAAAASPAASAAGRVVPVQQDGPYQLSITDVDWRPPVVEAGQDFTVIVTYANHEEALPVPDVASEEEEFVVDVQVVTVGESPKPVASCRAASPGVSGLEPGAESTFSCRLTVPIEGEYAIQAQILSADGQLVAETEQAGVVIVPVSGGLTGDLGRIFAGLAMFAAVMLIMALGTEVAIDAAKVALGMKSKVTSMDALEQLEFLLPGELSTLGVGAASQEQLSRYIQNMKDTLEPVISGAERAAPAIERIRAGEYGEAYQAIAEVLQPDETDGSSEAVSRALEGARAEAKLQLERILDRLSQADRLNLFGKGRAMVEEAVNRQIDRLTVENFAGLFTSWLPELVEGWLTSRHQMVVSRPSSELLALFDAKVAPELVNLGLDKGLAAETRAKLAITLDTLDTKAMQVSDTYMRSVHNLLESVEERRFEMQSPTRKLWRRLRQANKFTGTVTALALLWIVFSLLARPSLAIASISSGSPWLDWLLSIGAGVLVAAIFMLIPWLLGGIVCVYAAEPMAPFRRRLRGTLQRLSGTLTSRKPLELIETAWNWLAGRDLDPAVYDRPTSFEAQAKTRLRPETVAKILLTRSDQQRDEEKSRLRLLRVLSLFVGIGLAYLMQIDAAVLLDGVWPGSAAAINGLFFIDGATLHERWDLLPSTLNLTAGIVLTGLAASAGSGFWHELLGRMQASRKAAQTAARFVQEAKEYAASE